MTPKKRVPPSPSRRARQRRWTGRARAHRMAPHIPAGPPPRKITSKEAMWSMGGGCYCGLEIGGKCKNDPICAKWDLTPILCAVLFCQQPVTSNCGLRYRGFQSARYRGPRVESCRIPRTPHMVRAPWRSSEWCWRGKVVPATCTATITLRAQQPPNRCIASGYRLRTAVLIGRVTDTTGVGLVGAEITLLHSDRVHSITRDRGDSRLTGLEPGTLVFNVGRIGYERRRPFTAVLKPGRPSRELQAHRDRLALPTVAVSDTATHTHWLDRLDGRVARRHAARSLHARSGGRKRATGTDLVRTVPGIRLLALRGGAGYQVVMTRGCGGLCVPTKYPMVSAYSGMLNSSSPTTSRH